MTWDVLIRNGTLVDGTGGEPVRADVAVQGERIAAVGKLNGRAGRVIDAEGALVTPGFIDIHTHLDAQISWDPLATSPCWHGVTSVVMGNCGVTFAPCKPEDREFLARLMESVEDIPAKIDHDGAALGLGDVRRVSVVGRQAPQGHQRRRHGGPLRRALVGDGQAQPRAEDCRRGRHRAHARDRARRHPRRRARLLDLAHASCTRRPMASRCPARSPRPRSCSASETCSAKKAAASSRPCPTSTAPTRT